MGGMVREFDRMVTHRPPVLCAAHVQYLGRGLAGYGAHCNNNAVEVNNRRLKDQRKVEAGAIPELDLRRLISSKVTSTLKVSFRPPSDPPLACRVVDRPAAGIIHPRHRAVRCSSLSVYSVYTTLLIQLSCPRRKYHMPRHHEPAIVTGPWKCAGPALTRFQVPARGTQNAT